MNASTMPFGQLVRTRRESIGKSQKEAAAEIGISPVYLCDIEAGNRRAPEKHLAKIAEALEITDPEELNEFYDYAGISQKGRHYDINRYIDDKPNARLAFRTAMEKGWTDEDWQDLIRVIKEKGKR